VEIVVEILEVVVVLEDIDDEVLVNAVVLELDVVGLVLGADVPEVGGVIDCVVDSFDVFGRVGLKIHCGQSGTQAISIGC
jgi:hypothetical protein